MCVTWNPYQALEKYPTESTVDSSTFAVHRKQYTNSSSFGVFCGGQLFFSISVMLFYCHWESMLLAKNQSSNT